MCCETKALTLFDIAVDPPAVWGGEGVAWTVTPSSESGYDLTCLAWEIQLNYSL